MKLGAGGRFEKGVKKLEAKGMPEKKSKAIMAAAGRKKYGATKMAAMAAKGRKK